MIDPCEKVRDKIAESITGHLPIEQLHEYEEHLEHCPECRDYVSRLRDDENLLGDITEKLSTIVPRLETRVVEAIREDAYKKRTLSQNQTFFRTAFTAAIIGSVVVIAILTILAINFSPRNPKSRPVDMPDTAGKNADTEQFPELENLEKELTYCNELLNGGDVQGLINVLSQGSFAGKVIAAGFLAKLADPMAIEPLELAAAELGGENNVFHKNAQIIRDTIAAQTPAQQEPVAADDTAQDISDDVTLYRGTVTDVLGQPVPQVEVSVINYHPWPAAYKDSLKTEGTAATDDQGQFIVALLNKKSRPNASSRIRKLRFTHPDYAVGFYDLMQPPADNLEIQIPDPSIFSGWIFDELGQGIDDAQVLIELYPSPDNPSMGDRCTLLTTTDIQGRFIFADIMGQADIVRIMAKKPGYTLFTNFAKTPFATAGQEGFVIVLQKGVTLFGQLANNHQPFDKQGVLIRASLKTDDKWLRLAAVTNPDGTFEMPGLTAGTLTLAIANSELAATDLVANPAGPIQITLDQEPIAQIDLVPPANVTLEFYDEQADEPITDTKITIESQKAKGLYIARGTTTEMGLLTKPLAPGEYLALITRPNDPVTDTPVKPIEINFTVEDTPDDQLIRITRKLR